jgi:hypothetical protein
MGMCFLGHSKASASTGYIGFTALPNIPELSGLFFLLLNVISIVVELGICAQRRCLRVEIFVQNGNKGMHR